MQFAARHLTSALAALAFVACAVIGQTARAGNTLPGVVTYGGSKAGPIYIYGMSGCNEVPSVTLYSPGSFTMHGDNISPTTCAGGTQVVAFMDTLGTASYSEAADPIAVVTVSSGATSIPTLTLVDPTTNVSTLQGLVAGGSWMNPGAMALPVAGGAFVVFSPAFDANNVEVPDHYEIDATCITGSSPTVTIRAGGSTNLGPGAAMVRGLTDGASCTFSVTPQGQGSNLATAVTSQPVTIGAFTAPTTLQAQAAYQHTSYTDDLWMYTLDPITFAFGGVGRSVITTGGAATAFSIPGVPTGYNLVLGLVDLNQDGELGPDEPNSLWQLEPLSTLGLPSVSGLTDSVSGTVTIADDAAEFRVMTQNLDDQAFEYYVDAQSNADLVQWAQIQASGYSSGTLNCTNQGIVAATTDMLLWSQYHTDFRQFFRTAATTTPSTSDGYCITYQTAGAGSPSTVSVSPTGWVHTVTLDAPYTNFLNRGANVAWSVPTPPSGTYTQTITWQDTSNGNGLSGSAIVPSSQRSFTIPGSQLTSGDTYDWSVTISDSNSNVSITTSSANSVTFVAP